MSPRGGIALLIIGLAATALAQGKTYTIKGMGKHYTKMGKVLRKAAPHKKLPLVQLRTGPGFVLASEERSWGTKIAVDTLRQVMAQFEKEYPKQPLIVGDLSKKGGGVTDNHNSHVDGRDVDIHLPLNPLEDIKDRTPRTVNAGQTLFVLRALAAACTIEYVFVDKEVQRAVAIWAVNEGVSPKELELLLQYPRPHTKAVGVVRHWTNHQDHLHVRFVRGAGALDGSSKAYCEFRKRQRE